MDKTQQSNKRKAPYNPSSSRQQKTPKTNGCPPAEYLHSLSCKGQDLDVTRMRRILRNDPAALERPRPWLPNRSFIKTFPMHEASWELHKNCLEFMLQAGANINSKAVNLKGSTSSVIECAFLNFHISDKRAAVTELLLNHGASPNSVCNISYSSTTLLDNALRNHSNDVAQILLEHNAMIEDLVVKPGDQCNQNFIDHGTPLSTALNVWNLKGFKMLLLENASLVVRLDIFYPSIFITGVEYFINSIPHFVMLNAEKYMDVGYFQRESAVNLTKMALNIYKEFGGNLWVKHTDPSAPQFGEETLPEILRRRPQLNEKFGDLSVEFDQIASSPLSLRSLSRVVVRKSMGRNFYQNIDKLEIPQEVKEFLQHQDVIASNVWKDFRRANRIKLVNLFYY